MTNHRWPDLFGEQLAHPDGLTQISAIAREGLVITWSAHPMLTAPLQLVIERFEMEPDEGAGIFSMAVFNGQQGAPILWASLHRAEDRLYVYGTWRKSLDPLDAQAPFGYGLAAIIEPYTADSRAAIRLLS